jgi:TMEM175 potassium channel family protein
MRRTGSLSYVSKETGIVKLTAHEGVVAKSKATSERLGAFSDAIFAVIITIMVLDLRPPSQTTLAALLPLWPAALSYAVSYLFIAIVWVNHHHLLRFAEHATPRLIWVNFAHLFMVSLVPFSTAWVADTRLAAVPVSVYAAVFVLVNLAYCAFVWEVLAQAEVEEISARMRRITLTRSFLTLGLFVIAMLLSLKFPSWGFGSVCCVLLVYLWPEFHT